MTGKEIVERIDSILKEKNLKRLALAEFSNISVQTITDWSKRGSIPSADTAVKIAKYLNVSTDWLITGEDPQGLTEEERRLVDDWRELGADARKAVRAVLDTFVAESFEEKKVQAGKA